MNKYIGHPSQVSGVEEIILAKGKGKGMTLLEIRNGKGLCITLCPDRCMDIARISFKGDNVGYFAPCGYVAPAYYDNKEDGFLKSFYAGFMTTCGFTNAGPVREDNGETTVMHGNISNTPCESYCYFETEEEIAVKGIIRDASLFGKSYLLTREYKISKTDNSFTINDEVQNIGNCIVPCMILYHINIGYPMLSENSNVFIPCNSFRSRDEQAKKFEDVRLVMEKPQAGYEECCYYYDVKAVDNIASVGIFNPDIEKGVKISYNKSTLDCFTQWKMMGEHEYVLGLEPSNCTVDGRDVNRKNGLLKELKPKEKYNTSLKIELVYDTNKLN